MDKYNGLLRNASLEYSIDRGTHESITDFKSRIIYSIIGRMAMASLWDMPETGYVSINHLKNRIKELLFCYRQMYPEINDGITADDSLFADEIYNILMYSGCIYHEPNRIVISAKNDGCKGNALFTRGYPLSIKQCISGLGTYKTNIITAKSIKDLFLFDRQPLETYWESCTSRLEWNQMELDVDTEFLNMSPTYSSYWVTKGDNSGRVSILRIGPKGRQIYYFYKYENNNFYVSQIPYWRVENSYRALANACLKAYGALPKTEYVIDGDIVNIRFAYLPPVEEFYLWKLYSWPGSFLDLDNSFKRVCSLVPFEAIMSTMVELGYEFAEVNK
ncbi:hypothetical protein SAMN02910264_02313 [Ruminococcaceae bacterium YAD3003]|nr:hypothetical protein SAMN02910264_02313 [Ruminococcaceae bacterium YAD3003]